MEPRWEVQSAVVVPTLRSVSRWWTVSYLGSLDPGWPLVKLWNMEPRVGVFFRKYYYPRKHNFIISFKHMYINILICILF